MAQSADQIYKDAQQIVSEVLTAWAARIPDMNLTLDGIARLWTEVFANTTEGLYLGMQLLHDDMFIQTMNALALLRAGDQFGRPQKGGTVATGSVRFSGAGGTFIPLGSQVASPRPSLEDALFFQTTVDGQIPNPGIPDAPVAADASVGGSLTGTYEYAVTFQTAAGETEIGTISNALVLSASKANLTAIPLGGAGTTGRRIYRRVNGGAFGLVSTIANNSATTLSAENGSAGAAPPTDSTAERVTIAAQAVEAGEEYNAAVGAITDLADVVAGLSDVTNLAAFTGGSDPEDIEFFRSELLKRVRAPQSGSPADLESWATEIDGIETATAFPNKNLSNVTTAGTVSVRIAGPNGAIPDGTHVTAVQDALDARDMANITILVGTFTPVNVDVSVTIDLAPGYVLADVSPTVVTAITDYLNSIPVGGVVYVAGIYHAIFGLAGIDTVVVTTPSSDTTLTATQKAVAHTLTVT